MPKIAKVFLGIVTLWPIVYVGLFIAFFFSAFLFGPDAAETESGAPPWMAIFVGVHLLTMALILALTVFYIVDIFRNARVEKDKKALWAIVIFMGNAIAMPIYWYLYIWKPAELTPASPPVQLDQPPNWRE